MDDIEDLGGIFIRKHGDDKHGIIPDLEYDRLFDHLAEILKKHGTFAKGIEDADFSGYRYVDQMPWITIVPNESIAPAVAMAAGLEAVHTSHRPLMVEFDYDPEGLLIAPPNLVYSTFSKNTLAPLS